MSKKENKFEPSNGIKVAVHFSIVGIRAVAKELDMFPEALAEALDRAGFQVVADPFNISSDAGKVIALQERRATEGLQVVKEAEDE